MNLSAIKAAVRYLGCWCAMVFFVVLLTTIFSFLGTIICAVLAGMMMGAAKHRRWQAIPVAVVFPAVIFTMLRSTKAELLGRQVVVLSLLCFGAFWLTYLATSLLLVFEAKKPVTPAGQEGVPKEPLSAKPAPLAGPPEEGLAEQAERRLALADLQGEWSQPLAAHNGDGAEKTMEIKGDKVLLTARHADGRVRKVAEGQLIVGADQEGRPAPIPSLAPNRLVTEV
jgi:hypothetical protein